MVEIIKSCVDLTFKANLSSSSLDKTIESSVPIFV